jgi:hypothetical protein
MEEAHFDCTSAMFLHSSYFPRFAEIIGARNESLQKTLPMM